MPDPDRLRDIDPADPVDHECLRCGVTEPMRYPGLCAGCRTELRATIRGEAREVEVAAYEPTQHVTPNAVALKAD